MEIFHVICTSSNMGRGKSSDAKFVKFQCIEVILGQVFKEMPSSLLNGEIPYFVLFPTKNLFPIAPKIFGCVCFVRDVRSHHTKLDPESLKCIFLGYSCVQKVSVLLSYP